MPTILKNVKIQTRTVVEYSPPAQYYEYQIPGQQYINESIEIQAQVPGGAFVNVEPQYK